MSESCENCHYRREVNGAHQCRRRAPVVTTFPVPVQGIQGMSMQFHSVAAWPAVEPGGWCGEWASNDWAPQVPLVPLPAADFEAFASGGRGA